MTHQFLRQFWALFRKNWLVFSKHKLITILRSIILPIAYGVFLAVAQVFLVKPNHYGIGTPAPIQPLSAVFDSRLSFIWADGTTEASPTSPSPADVMNVVMQGLTVAQRKRVRRVDSPDDIPQACPQNFNLFSECFAAVAFHSLPSPSNNTTAGASNFTDIGGPALNSTDPLALPNGTSVLPPTSILNYTIRADAGLGFIDVVKHQSDFEKRVLPVQWAVDSAILQLQTNNTYPTPLEWPFSMETDQEQTLRIRLSYVRGVRTLLVLTLFFTFLGISYHLPGSYITERTAGLTSHLRAMGLKDAPRILSWHASLSLLYLPAWTITALLWRYRIFSGTNVGIILVVHIVTGLSLGSSAFLLSFPPLSPSLAASITTFLSIILAVGALAWAKATTAGACIFLLAFPAGFYVFAIRAIAGFEVHQIPTSLVKPDPDHGLILLPLILVALFDVFLHPFIAVWLERRFYDAHEPPQRRSWFNFGFWRRPSKPEREPPQSPSESSEEPPAIIISHLSKHFSAPFSIRFSSFLPFRRQAKHSKTVIAISDLSLSIPRGGIYVLLGNNGAGKSTVLGILGGLVGRSGGVVQFPAPRGKEEKWKPKLGIVPQKNILFPELTCLQTLRVWSAVKGDGIGEEDFDMLLEECGLKGKGSVVAGTLSGGQKRKLGLAVGLVGGSEIVLVDECTSGVDPLSRRAIWKTLTRVKRERTIVFTTHFLDEADLLADTIAVISTPGGKLVASGSPVYLKSTLGQGYSINVTFASTSEARTSAQLLTRIQSIAPNAMMQSGVGVVVYSLKERNAGVVKQVLEIVEAMEGVERYDVRGTSVEDIFLGLMQAEDGDPNADDPEKSTSLNGLGYDPEKNPDLTLTPGRKKNPLSQSLTIFYKRFLIFRRAPLSPLLAVLLAICGSCIPLFFLTSRPKASCTTIFAPAPRVPLYLGDSQYSSLGTLSTPGSSALVSPPGLVTVLGKTLAGIPLVGLSDAQTFMQTVHTEYRNLSLGGLSVDTNTNQALIAWEGTPPGLTGPTILNLASNVLYNNALNASGRDSAGPTIIAAGYQSFPAVDGGTLFGLKWLGFFGATMGAFPAFFALYVARERKSSVQEMQLSNGLTNPVGLWLGHLLFDGVFCVILSTIIIVIFAAVSSQFHGLGYFWVVMVLHGLAAALFAYCVSLVTPSPLAAFAVVAGYEVIMFILYVAGYLLTLTYARSSRATEIMTILHFTTSLASPVASVLRAALVSVNLFSLLCSHGEFSPHALGSITKYGGPICYLLGDCLVFFAFLVYFDSGSILPSWLRFRFPGYSSGRPEHGNVAPDVLSETEAVEKSTTDLLRVLHISKSFERSSSTKAVDDVSFGVSQDTVFAMLGPNGAGKTSIFNIIRGSISPSSGDVYINGTSIISHPNTARLSLGLCPQFTAIDPQLTVREHLEVYGLLKGLKKEGGELKMNVEGLLKGTMLSAYAERLANRLSGGNQRKLAFAIALIGNPMVVLIDEYSTGIDAATKRSMWKTFRSLARGKAVVITTHSMEEASALASKVGILASRLLAIGSTSSLASRYATYEVHFPARTPEETLKAQQLMARIPGARIAEDVATRFEVPIQQGDNTTSNLSLAKLFELLSEGQDAFPQYTVERVGLESVFLKVVREGGAKEEEEEVRGRRWRRWKVW